MTETRRNGHRSGAALARWMCRASPARMLGAFLGFWLRGVLQKCKPLRRLLRGLCCAAALIRSSFRRACCHWARVASAGGPAFAGQQKSRRAWRLVVGGAYALMVAAWVAMLATVAGVNVITAAVVLQQRERKTLVTFHPAAFNSAVKWVDSGVYL